MAQTSGGSGARPWLIGCGVGCLVLIILGVVAAVGIYFASQKALKVAGKALSQQINADYTRLKASNQVPAEHAELFDEIVAVSQQETTSTAAMSIIQATMTSIFADNNVSSEEANQAKTVHDFIIANPQCSFLQMGTFFAEHPELSTLKDAVRQPRWGPNNGPPAESVPAEVPAK